jgi:hypothetical protein
MNHNINNQIPNINNLNNQYMAQVNNNNNQDFNNNHIQSDYLPGNSNSLNSNQYNYNNNNQGNYINEVTEDINNINKKKNLMENIQQQISYNKNSKIKELERKRAEDQKYLSEMNNNFPFGRNGAGAPLRDGLGNIITKRKGLISDNKMANEETSNINNILSDITQRISSGANVNGIGNNNLLEPRYNSARNYVKK